MKDVMIWIDTLSSAYKPVIMGIGLVKFDLKNKRIGESSLIVLDVESMVREGGKVDPEVAFQWMDGLGNRLDYFLKDRDNGVKIDEAIKSIRQFCSGSDTYWANYPERTIKDIETWCSSTFSVYMMPWRRQQVRCVRTAMALGNQSAATEAMENSAPSTPVEVCISLIDAVFAAQS